MCIWRNRLIQFSIWVMGVRTTPPPPPMDYGSGKSIMDERVKINQPIQKVLTIFTIGWSDAMILMLYDYFPSLTVEIASQHQSDLINTFSFERLSANMPTMIKPIARQVTTTTNRHTKETKTSKYCLALSWFKPN